MALAPGLKRRGGLFGASANQPIAPEMTATSSPMAPAKPKFFGEGGAGRSIAGNIGDFLLQYSGMQPIYQPEVQRRQAMAYEQQQRERSRLADWQDKIAFAQWERENPRPVNNDTINDFNWYKGLSPGDQKIYDAMHPIVVDVTDDNGRVTKQLVPRSQLIGGGATETPQVGAIEDGYRFKGGDPADKGNWEPFGAPPVSAAPSRPNTVARSAYQAWVNQLGQAEADAMLRRNGLSVGNY